MRSSGVLMHISSLPSPYGIGTMGKEARKFVDFLDKSGQKYWQILPICPTSYGDSPYQSFSSFAGNPYFIDLEYLCKEKLLTKKECESLEGVVSQYDTYLDTHFQMDVLECLKEKLQEKLRLDLFMLVEIHQFQFNL